MKKARSQSRDPVELVETLSPRQWQIAELIAQGWMDKEAAPFLGISISTLRTHLKSIYRKLSVKRRAGIAVLCDRFRYRRELGELRAAAGRLAQETDPDRIQAEIATIIEAADRLAVVTSPAIVRND